MSATTETPYIVTPERVSAALKSNGWFCHHEMQHNKIPISCSIGMMTSGLPFEVVILGVDEKLSRVIMALLLDRFADGVEAPQGGSQINNVLAGYSIELVELDAAATQRLNGVINEKTGASVRKAMLVQVPDKNGHLPSVDACCAAFKSIQSIDNIGGMK